MFWEIIYKNMTNRWIIIVFLLAYRNRSGEQIKKRCNILQFFHPFFIVKYKCSTFFISTLHDYKYNINMYKLTLIALLSHDTFETYFCLKKC